MERDFIHGQWREREYLRLEKEIDLKDNVKEIRRKRKRIKKKNTKIMTFVFFKKWFYFKLDFFFV